MERKAQEAQLKLELEERKADDRKETDEDRIDQQKDALAIRSAIAAEKLEKDSKNKMMDKAEKITANLEKTTANLMNPNGRQQ